MYSDAKTVYNLKGGITCKLGATSLFLRHVRGELLYPSCTHPSFALYRGRERREGKQNKGKGANQPLLKRTRENNSLAEHN